MSPSLQVVPPYDQGEFVLHDFERVLRRTSAVGTPNPSPRGVTSARTVEPMQGSNAVVPSEDTSDGAGVVYSQVCDSLKLSCDLLSPQCCALQLTFDEVV